MKHPLITKLVALGAVAILLLIGLSQIEDVVRDRRTGGIRKVADAAVYIALVREILGDAAVTPQRLRFGASGLLGDITAVLQGGGPGNTSAAGTY